MIYRVLRQGGIKLGGKHLVPLGAVVEPLGEHGKEVERLVKQGYLEVSKEGKVTFKFPEKEKKLTPPEAPPVPEGKGRPFEKGSGATTTEGS